MGTFSVQINAAQTWTGLQTFNSGITLDATTAITIINQGAGSDPLLSSDSASQFLSLTGGLIISANLLSNGDIIMANAKDIQINTTTGTKIGTGTTQKIGFWNAAPVVQPGHIIDADGNLADITTKFNQLLADIAGQGLQASS